MPYLPLLNRNVITRACGALILAPYLRNKQSVISLPAKNLHLLLLSSAAAKSTAKLPVWLSAMTENNS